MILLGLDLTRRRFLFGILQRKIERSSGRLSARRPKR